MAAELWTTYSSGCCSCGMACALSGLLGGSEQCIANAEVTKKCKILSMICRTNCTQNGPTRTARRSAGHLPRGVDYLSQRPAEVVRCQGGGIAGQPSVDHDPGGGDTSGPHMVSKVPFNVFIGGAHIVSDCRTCCRQQDICFQCCLNYGRLQRHCGSWIPAQFMRWLKLG
jgi:hypothetical protein